MGIRRLATREALADAGERERLRAAMRGVGLSQTGVQTLTTDQLRRIVAILEETP